MAKNNRIRHSDQRIQCPHEKKKACWPKVLSSRLSLLTICVFWWWNSFTHKNNIRGMKFRPVSITAIRGCISVVCLLKCCYIIAGDC